MTGSVSPPEKLRGIEDAWRAIHSGPGHEPTDSKGARRARRRQEYGSRAIFGEGDVLEGAVIDVAER